MWRDDPAALLAGARAAPSRSCSSASTACWRPPTWPRSRAAPAPRRPAPTIVAEHPSDLVRDQYVMKLAGELDIDADRLRDTVARHRKEQVAGGPRPAADRPSTDAAPPARRPPVHVDRRELDVLLYAVHEPELVVDWLDARLFADPVAAARSMPIASSRRRSTTRSRQSTARCAICSNVSQWKSRSDRTNPKRCARDSWRTPIGPAAQRVLAGMLRAGDDRATSLKLLLDALAHAEANRATGKPFRRTPSSY